MNGRDVRHLGLVPRVLGEVAREQVRGNGQAVFGVSGFPVVNASAGPLPASMSACFNQLRSADSVKPRSCATCVMLPFPACHHPTAFASNSGLNFLRALRFATGHSWRFVAPFGCPPNRGNSTWSLLFPLALLRSGSFRWCAYRYGLGFQRKPPPLSSAQTNSGRDIAPARAWHSSRRSACRRGERDSSIFAWTELS